MQERPRSLNGLAVLAMAALALVAAIEVAEIVTDVHYRSLIDNAVAAGFVPAGIKSVDHRRHELALASLGALVVSGVFFLSWFYRAYANLQGLGISGLRWGRDWAIWAWLIPFLNLFRPPRMAADIWRGSDPRLPPRSELWRGVTPGIVWAWWTTLLVGGIVGRVSAQLEASADTASQLRTGVTAVVLSHVLTIAAAVLAIALVRGITTRQKERSAVLTVGGRSLTTSTTMRTRVQAFAGPPPAVERLRTPGGKPCQSCGFENHELAATCIRCHKRL